MADGSKKGIMVKPIHMTILADHHPECHEFLGSSNFEVPAVERNIVIKNVWYSIKAHLIYLEKEKKKSEDYRTKANK
jgi:hypothetical protein